MYVTVAPLLPLKVKVAVLLEQTGLLFPEMEAVGGETVKVLLGPAAAALLPTPSVAVFAFILIPIVPAPVIPLKVTVRVVVPAPETPTVAVAEPVVVSVMLEAAKVTLEAPV